MTRTPNRRWAAMLLITDWVASRSRGLPAFLARE